jgi:hypothetical protein
VSATCLSTADSLPFGHTTASLTLPLCTYLIGRLRTEGLLALRDAALDHDPRPSPEAATTVHEIGGIDLGLAHRRNRNLGPRLGSGLHNGVPLPEVFEPLGKRFAAVERLRDLRCIRARSWKNTWVNGVNASPEQEQAAREAFADLLKNRRFESYEREKSPAEREIIAGVLRWTAPFVRT